jgi:hypothetical protein
MPPLVYLDQNAVITLGRNAQDDAFKERLCKALESHALTVVVSSWHLIETANTKNVQNAIRLAEFIDSLQPAWLLERYDIQKIEIHDEFFKFARIPYQAPPKVTTRSAVIAALSRKRDGSRFDIPSRKFVEQWIANPDQLKPLDKVYADNVDGLIRLRELKKEGKITAEIQKRSNQVLLREHVPARTPNGLEIGRELATAYIESANISVIPTISIELAISQQEWISTGGADRNTLIDKFHLISALPYVDEIVSDDKFFRKVYPAALATGHVRAKLVTNAEFLKRF